MTNPWSGSPCKKTPNQGSVSVRAESLVPGLLSDAITGGDALVVVAARPPTVLQIDEFLHHICCFDGTASDFVELRPRVSELDENLPGADPDNGWRGVPRDDVHVCLIHDVVHATPVCFCRRFQMESNPAGMPSETASMLRSPVTVTISPVG